MIRLTFLGTGTSQGVPMIACPCEVCHSSDVRDRRLRTSALVQVGVEGDRGFGGSGIRVGEEACGDGGACGDGSGERGVRGDGGDGCSARGDAGGDGCGDGGKARDGMLNIVIDAGPDFRAQMLGADVRRVDAILLTHEHKDHTGGIDDVRAYNYFTDAPVDVYATEHVQAALRKDYEYAFEEHPYPGAPQITLHTIADDPFEVRRQGEGADENGGNAKRDVGGGFGGGEKRDEADKGANDEGSGENGGGFGGVKVVEDGDGNVEVKAVEVVPVRGVHLRLPVTGFRIGGLAYLTDFNGIDDSEIEKLRGLEVLVVNALGHKPHISHFNLEQAIELARRVGARRTYLTHISHRMGLYDDVEPTLPEGVHLAYDNLTIEI